jgi:putative tricarboxylic transport membrane protein
MFWLVVAGLICFGAFKLTLGTPKNPGVGFFPFITGSLLGLLSLIVFLQSWGVSKAVKPAAMWPDKGKMWKVLLTVAALLVYGFAMDYLGFLLCTVLFLGFLLRVVEPQRWTVVIGGSLLASFVSYGIFALWLKAELPNGLLFQYLWG